MRSELVFYRNYIKASIYQPEIESSRNFAIHFDRLALLRSRPSIVTNLLKRIAILHKHPCNPARRISLEMPRRSGADITFLLDRLDERRNRYPCIPPSPSVSSRFLFSYVTHLRRISSFSPRQREKERERESFPPFVFAFTEEKFNYADSPRGERDSNSRINHKLSSNSSGRRFTDDF